MSAKSLTWCYCNSTSPILLRVQREVFVVVVVAGMHSIHAEKSKPREGRFQAKFINFLRHFVSQICLQSVFWKVLFSLMIFILNQE